MTTSGARIAAREVAREYERGLDATRRKSLGQYFSGVSLGKLLGHLGIRSGTRTVIDPMAGHGDLLDAAIEVAVERGARLERIDGIEVDDITAAMCRDRLSTILGGDAATESTVLSGNAFGPEALNALAVRNYDLVITNPPFVRYQKRSEKRGRADSVRSALETIVDGGFADNHAGIWRTLVQSYSGLADLSVPAWILAAFLVRPGGRLALVVPTTWRSREYADVIRYLLLRLFELEIVVSDSPPGWFCDALVRTQLIVARRLSRRDARVSLSSRSNWSMARWVDVGRVAANEDSLVGAAFPDAHPEARFSDWVRQQSPAPVTGVAVRDLDLRREWNHLRSQARRRRWYGALEGARSLAALAVEARSTKPDLPYEMRRMLPKCARLGGLVTLDETGVKVGQGLRTGCNAFFYVTECGNGNGNGDGDTVRVSTSPALGGRVLTVPASILRPVLRRQSEISVIREGNIPLGRVLDLRAWILPEDAEQVDRAKIAYARQGSSPPRVMCSELAEHVRFAATVPIGKTGDGKVIPDLSAVRTNVRRSRNNKSAPRFWYMLPDFSPRHLPLGFVPRINQGTAWIECNIEPPLLVDANFSTFWTLDDEWSPFAIKALLNSVWCRAYIEVAGTPLGGGALKLEAVHLRNMPTPLFTEQARTVLHAAGKCLRQDTQDVQSLVDRTVLQAVFPDCSQDGMLAELAIDMAVRTSALCAARQRVKS